jgi:hypothetical protein
MRQHFCVGGEVSFEPTWWVNDAQGIPLARVCYKCKREKLSRFRPEILSGYDQSDVDEPIDGE